MNVVEFLTNLSHQGVTLWVDGDQLRYRAPGGVMTASLRTELTRYKQELLIELSQRQDNAVLPTHVEAQEKLPQTSLPLIPMNRTQEIPLSFAQQRLWFLDQLHGGSSAYMFPMGLHLSGPLNRKALEQSLVELVRRHEILRTTFIAQSGQPVQVVHAQGSLSFPFVDMRAIASEECAQEIHRLNIQEVLKPRNLAEGPLLNTYLVQLDAQQYTLLLILHHLIGDGWSLTICLDELSKLYAAFSAGLPSSLPDLPIQYADFAMWQQKRSQEQSVKKQLDYWVKQLTGIVPLELPLDHPRPSIQTFHGARQSCSLSRTQLHKLKDLSRQEGVTLFMTLLATLKALIFRYTGQADVVVGMTVANRLLPEFENLIGFFANTLVMRTKIPAHTSFRSFLGNVREIVIEGIANQDVPFEEIVDKLQPERHLSHSPLFQVVFTLHNTLPADLSFGDVLVTPFFVESGTAKFDLSVEMMETDQGLDIVLEYNTDLFEPNTIHKLIASYGTLLAGIIANANQPLNELPLLTDADRNQLLTGWNTTSQHTETPHIPLHRAFEEQVRQRPDCIAIIFEDATLTYAQLNEQANQLAHYLQHLGVGPETMVGLCLERSPYLLIGLLAILKAGGAYVPLDPSNPPERLQFIIADANIHTVVTSSTQLATIQPLDTNVPLLCLDRDAPLLATQNTTNLPGLVDLDHLAYVIYTSGSTGTPKGVQVTHANVHRLFTRTQSWFQFHAEDVWTLFHSYAFDFSVWEIWGALLYGGRLVIVPYWISRSPDSFYALLHEQYVTVLNQTPSAFRLLMQVAMLNTMVDDLALRLVIFGGEALNIESLRPWITRYGDQHPQLINMYGITETTVHVTYRMISQADLATNANSVIGWAIPDLQTYILDPQQCLLPIGIPGELYVGGMGLARGYLHRPQLTAERFIPNPFSTTPGARLYRTGDLARYRANGDLEYLGRIDQQVKIRGHRIELGEIESILKKHSHVRDAIVQAKEDTTGNTFLVAYVLSHASDTVASDLRTYLHTKLPDYMVPAFYVSLESFPLTANGKVDLRALPAPTAATSRSEKSLATARTPIEEIILAIYQEILGLDQINIHESFFHLGGHSLLATQIVSRIRAALGVEVSLRALFETPSVAGLAQKIEQNQRSLQESVLPPLCSVERTQDLPLSFAQQRLWVQEQLTSGHSAYGLPIAIKLQGPLHIAILEQSVQEIIYRHESLRTTFVTHAGKPFQMIHADYHTTLAVTDLHAVEQSQQPATILQLLHMKMVRPFDLTSGPLLRTGLFILHDQEYVFYLVMHHIIFDAWSVGIFFRELSTLYNAFLQGMPSPLLMPPFQYADFALWQRGWLEGKILNTLTSYWTKQLRGAQPLELPTDQPRTDSVSNNGAAHLFTLPSELTQKLITLSRQEGVTLFMTLLTSFQILLHAYTGALDIVVGTDIANRTSAETEDMIGFFINLLVLRTQLSTRNTFRETLKSVCAMVLHAYAHQDLPFDQLIDALQLKRNPHQIPLVNILFVLQNVPTHLLKMHDLAAATMDITTTTAKFDVSVFLIESASALTGYVNYRTDLFHPATIARMMHHFEILLWDVVNSPDKLIEGIDMFSEEEKAQKSHAVMMEREAQSSKLKSTKRRLTALAEPDLIRSMEEK